MEKIVLKNIAEIKTGFSFRSRIHHVLDGEIHVIQMKDLDSCCVSAKNNFIKIQDNIKESYFVKKYDLFFKSRGKVNGSSLLLDDIKAVLSAPLLLIRIKDNQVLPEYLNWYISSKPAQNYFDSISGGTFQRVINKSALEKLEVQIPTLEKQTMIVELTKLASKESELLEQLKIKKEKYFNKMLINLIQGE